MALPEIGALISAAGGPAWAGPAGALGSKLFGGGGQQQQQTQISGGGPANRGTSNFDTSQKPGEQGQKKDDEIGKQQGASVDDGNMRLQAPVDPWMALSMLMQYYPLSQQQGGIAQNLASLIQLLSGITSANFQGFNLGQEQPATGFAPPPGQASTSNQTPTQKEKPAKETM